MTIKEYHEFYVEISRAVCNSCFSDILMTEDLFADLRSTFDVIVQRENGIDYRIYYLLGHRINIVKTEKRQLRWWLTVTGGKVDETLST